MFRKMHDVNKNIPWLQRKFQAQSDWNNVYEVARNKSLTLPESKVWNDMPKSKATIENTIGKEAMQMAIREENSKRGQPSDDDDDVDVTDPKRLKT